MAFVRQTNRVERLVKQTLRQIELLAASGFSIGDTVVADRGPKVFPQYATGVIIEQQDAGYVIQFRDSDGGGVETHKANRLTLLKAAPKNASKPAPESKPRAATKTPRTRLRTKQPDTQTTLFTQDQVQPKPAPSPAVRTKTPVPQVNIKKPGIFGTDIFKDTATFWGAYQRGAAENKIGLVLNAVKPRKTPGNGWEHENKFGITSVDQYDRYALSAYLGFLARYIQQTKQFDAKSVGGNINQRGELYGTFIFSRKPGTGTPLTIRISHVIKVTDTLWGVSAEPVSNAAGDEDNIEKWLKSVEVPVSARILENADTFLDAVNKYSFGKDRVWDRQSRPSLVQGYGAYVNQFRVDAPEDEDRADRICSYLAMLATGLKKMRQFTLNTDKGKFSDTALAGAVKFVREDDGMAIILICSRTETECRWAIMAK